MLELIKKIISYKFFPICWTLLIIILLCLPGSMVPGKGLFGLPNLDKVVHIFLFGMNVLFWGWHYASSYTPKQLKKAVILLMVSTIALGIVLEYVQLYFIPNRSFDGADILADACGAVLAGFWLLK